MEPDVMVVHPSQPSLDVRDDLPSEEEFGDFGGLSDEIPLQPSPSSLVSQHPPTETPASHQPNLQQCRLTSRLSEEPTTVLSNGLSSAAAQEETGFADFTVLTEEASHSWCCGFSPVAEQWSNETGKAHRLNKAPQEVVVEPKSSCVSVKKDCTGVRSQLSQAAVTGPGCVWDRKEPSEREVADGGQESPADSSFCDDISFEGCSEDLEHNVSSLACTSPEDQTDVEEDEEERSISSLGGGMEFCLTRAAQETSATSTHERPVASRLQAAEVPCLSSLPPSDSFADFCSAREDEDGSWEEFEAHKTVEQNGTGHLVLQKDEQEEAKPQVSDRVQNLVHNSFPEGDGEEEEEQEVPSLGALLHLSGFEEEKEATPALSLTSSRVQRGCWWPHRELHTAVGLQFQWAGSHTNRSLLRCLGVDTKNIVFVGVKKQPVCVPAFASSLGMLEPTKDSSSGAAVASERRHSLNSEQAEERGDAGVAGEGCGSVLSQDPLSSSLLVASSRGLSSSQDGCCTLDLDYFGPEEESGSSRGSNTPPPGVDPELYNLTVCRLEVSMKRLENALSDLMAASENTSVRRPDPEEELSPEASRTLSALPSLSFMKAAFLMFPCSLAEEPSNT
ncbi:aftiphilin isoform X1 [Synchiropus splendidus]|uniref:aftiphilin isoform X1 n=1 Tax=Synchiropus splendidus TaxID=270530 RepID=UPI00237E8D2A|nr:aftiphilin isoform X1 [Synchiropus splendidus]XP_053731073.1 aftiphilin isoform X1 [Synchiropus splendidus]